MRGEAAQRAHSRPKALAHFWAEKCFFRGACPRKKRIGLLFRVATRKTLRGKARFNEIKDFEANVSARRKNGRTFDRVSVRFCVFPYHVRLLLTLNKNLTVLPTEIVPYGVGFLDHISPLCSAKAALSGAISAQNYKSAFYQGLVYDVGAGLVPARLGRSHVRENGRPQGSELRHERRFHTRRGRRPAHGRARRFRTRVRPCRRGGACPRPFRSVSCPGNGRPQGSPLRHKRRFPP